MGTSAIILIILLILSGIFSGIEIAIFSLSDAKIQALVNANQKNAKTLQAIKSKPQLLLSTILIGNNVVNIGASAFATVVSTRLFGSSGAGIAVGVMTFLILIFGEITPKAIATAKNESVSLMAAKPMHFLIIILFPVVWLLERLTKYILKLVKAPEKTEVSEEEIKAMITQGQTQGSIETEEKKLLENVFEFNDLTAEDAMTVFREMYSVDSGKKLFDLLKKLADSPFSRIPVYEGDKGNIVGILQMSDVIRFVGDDLTDGKLEQNVLIKDLMIKPFFVPESKPIDEILNEFKRRHKHIAIVVNEYGDTVGLITMEDILEQLVGSIIDETDVEENVIKRIDKYNIIVDGVEDLEEINDFFNIHIKGPKSNTISWKILEHSGNIPKRGDSFKIDGVIITIIEATDRSIEKVRITKKENSSKDEKN